MYTVFFVLVAAVGIFAGLLIERLKAKRRQPLPLDASKLQVISVAGLTVEQAYNQYYAGFPLLDHGHMAHVWCRPQTYPRAATNAPVTSIQKDANGIFWVLAFGYDQYLPGDTPYREFSGDLLLKGYTVEGAYVLPEVGLVVYQP